MKKTFTLICLLVFSAAAAFSQSLVTTQPLNKNVILEEFTGIHCQYCPEGHAIAASIVENNPGRAASIAIHQGSFASPNAGEPDYRTPFGDAIAGQTGLTGYPAGTVNRHVFTGTTTALSRGDWTASSDIILQQPSPVNVGVETSYNAGTRELTVHVELYYTAASAVPGNYIHVALIQSHIFGPQTGGGAGNNYEHMEMLRYLITGQWGDPVTTTTAGSLVDRTYTYTIPADYNAIPCVVENCEVVAFVTEGHQEILSGDVVPAIDGTNLYIGDITTPEPVMKLGHPGVTTDFNLVVNSNLQGTETFKLKLKQHTAGGWSSGFDINGQTMITDSTTISVLKGVPMPLLLHALPGDSAGFGDFTFELSSLTNPNAPVKTFTVSLLSNVTTLLVNAAGDNYATQFSGVYTTGLKAAGCNNFAVIKSNKFVQANDAGIFTEIRNLFYNCAWTFPAFTDPEALAVKAFVDSSRNFFVAGQDIGWDIMSNASGSHGTVVTKDLYTNYMKAAFVADGSATNNKLVAKTADPIYGAVAISSLVDVYGGNMYPDEISPVQDAITTFYYNTTQTKIGAVRSLKGMAKVSYFGVGLEMVQNVDVRNDILSKTYWWFMEGVGIGDKTDRKVAVLGQNYPNPASDNTSVSVRGNTLPMTLQVTDITGRILQVYPVSAGTGTIQLSTSSLSTGLYLYKLVCGNEVVDVRKMEVRR